MVKVSRFGDALVPLHVCPAPFLSSQEVMVGLCDAISDLRASLEWHEGELVFGSAPGVDDNGGGGGDAGGDEEPPGPSAAIVIPNNGPLEVAAGARARARARLCVCVCAYMCLLSLLFSESLFSSAM